MDESVALLALALLPGVGERRLHRVLASAREREETVEAALRRPPAWWRNELGLPESAGAALRAEAATGFRRARILGARLRRSGVLLLGCEDAAYPPRLIRRLSWPPPLLTLYGNRDVLTAPTVTLLSSREITAHLVNATILAARCAAEDGFSVVVGGMKSTHRIAATTVRAARAARSIVLDRGLLAAFSGNLQRDPFGFGPGRSAFHRETTLVVSRFRPEDHANRGNARKRDELLASLGDVLFVTSARPGGETERLCAAAIDRGLCVLLWQGENRGLVEAGAHPVDEHEIRQGFRRFLPTCEQSDRSPR